MRNNRRRRRKTILFSYGIEEESKKMRIIKEVLIWAVEILLVIFLAYLVLAYGVEKTTVVGGSMEPILSNNNKVLVNKFAYRFTSPKRFDIIVFRPEGKEHSYYTIKRVVGLPGEKIQIKDGKVYVNGDELDEKVDVEAIINEGLADEVVTLDEDEYFVLGDNRNNSEDSRFANVGNVTKEEIVGKAWIRLHPFEIVNWVTKSKSDETE